MDRRRFIGNLAFGTLAVPHVVRGQPAATIRRVGILSFPSEPAVAPQLAAFTQAMDDLGWLEGKNIMYRVAYANGDVARLDVLANDMVGQKVEIILAASPPSTRAAQRATKTIPIVMGSVSNPVGNGFVAKSLLLRADEVIQ